MTRRELIPGLALYGWCTKHKVFNDVKNDVLTSIACKDVTPCPQYCDLVHTSLFKLQRFNLSKDFEFKRFSTQSTNDDTTHGEASIPRDVYLVQNQLECDSSRDKSVILPEPTKKQPRQYYPGGLTLGRSSTQQG